MDTKLTLRLDKRIIDEIKLYALKNELSLSSLTEDLYKNILLNLKKQDNDITSPIANKYRGLLEKSEIDEDKIKYDYLMEKHSE